MKSGAQNLSPAFSQCFDIFERNRDMHRSEISNLEGLRRMMSKDWQKEIDTLIKEKIHQDRHFGHNRADIVGFYNIYKMLRSEIPFEESRHILIGLCHYKMDYHFLKGCEPIFEAMYKKEIGYTEDE